MSKFEFPPSIRSRPVYGEFSYKDGVSHLFIADAEGGEAILDLAKKHPDMMANAHIIYIPKSAKLEDKLAALNPAQFYVGPSYEAALPRIRHVLAAAEMGLQIYLSGSEGMMGQAQNEAMNAGVPHEFIQTEHRGTVARRMQCVHCKGITEDVITDPFECSHCGLNLFVRDHYSRRLAAFQAVRVDAEDHGNVPVKVELYK